MYIQYYIVAIIVAIIVFCQIGSFIKNILMIKKLKVLFPSIKSLLYMEHENSIYCNSINKEFKDTYEDINNYLKTNKNKAADYQIIKEIVERNSLKIEEDVDTMSSSPLYLGLMATILGAAIGVVFFAWTDLEALLTGTQIQTEGIKTLLTDIGIAMVASFLGVMFTAISTSNYKDSRNEMLKKKNQFLSWIQVIVMPNMSDDLSGVLTKMTDNLNLFNSTFKDNTEKLEGTLSHVSDNYKNQVQLLDAIEKIKITKIAKVNVEVFDKLQDCTEVLEKLFEHLGNSEEYISNVKTLNERLGAELSRYFNEEMDYVANQQDAMKRQMNDFDSVMRDATENLRSSLEKNAEDLTIVYQKQQQTFDNLIESQNESLSNAFEVLKTSVNKKMEEFSSPLEDINATFMNVDEKVRESIGCMSSTFEAQNSAIAEMLATQKSILEVEIEKQREELKEQIAIVPSQMNELAKVLDKLNKTIENQQKKIDIQGETIKELADQMGATSGSKEKSKGGIMYYFISFGAVGSFILLLALLLVQLFGFTIKL